MKHKLLSFLLIIGLLISLSFETVKGQLFNVGDKDLNFTVGLGTPWVLKRSYYRTQLPLITASFDVGLRDNLGPGVLSLGGCIGANTYKYEIPDAGWIYEYGWKSTSVIGALRSTYHYQIIDALDTYGGLHLGVRFEGWREYGDIPYYYTIDFNTSLHPVINLIAGVKFHFSDNLFVMGELGLGFGIALFNIGLGLKM